MSSLTAPLLDLRTVECLDNIRFFHNDIGRLGSAPKR